MAGEETTNQGNIKIEYNQGVTGMNMDNTVNQIPKGALTYALNASVENFDSNSINYQNEPGNEFCLQFPDGYQLIGKHFIPEKSKHIFFLANPTTGNSQIGYMYNNNCKYVLLVEAPCLNFNVHYPIHKVVHKITNCATEIYWTDGYNPRRYLDIENIPYLLNLDAQLCNPTYTDQLDCNQLKLQPNFSIPELTVVDVRSGGDLTAGTYQFAIQYCDASGNGYSSFYSVTNPTPIADPSITTPNFNYTLGRSIIIDVKNLDGTGQFQYFNLAVIKTVNNIPSVELVGTFYLDNTSKQITYNGQNKTQIKLTINDIFEKYPYYDIAQDLTTVQDILVWDNLTSIDRINYQNIANQITVNWETYRIPDTEDYSDEINATNLRGYLRDEVYAFEIVFLLKNGKQTDGFHIPGRIKGLRESVADVPNTDPDFIGEPDYTIAGIGYSPYWKIYNTASITGLDPDYNPSSIYKGPYQYGEMAYWESSDVYPCNTEVWGPLSGQRIRHHKFPDVLVSPIYESKLFTGVGSMVMGNNAVYPIGIRIDVNQVAQLIKSSNLTDQQKSDIASFKIVRGDRGTNKSIVAKGILRNVNKYEREGQYFYYPNYPYNDLSADPLLLKINNAWLQECKPWRLENISPNAGYSTVSFTYISCNNNKEAKSEIKAGTTEICSIGRPCVAANGSATIGPANYIVWSACNHGTLGYNVKWNEVFVDQPSNACGTRSVYKEQWIKWRFSDCNTPYIRLNIGETPSDDCSNEWWQVFKCAPSFNSYNVYSSLVCDKPVPLEPLTNSFAEVGNRLVFNSPETSFGQPFLGNVLKLESVMFGQGKGHFVEVKKNALYKLLSKEQQQDSLESSEGIGGLSNPFNGAAMFASYQAYLTIYVNGIIRKNYAYSYNTRANYDYSNAIPNGQKVKQRNIQLTEYLIPGVQSVGDDLSVNNYQRESSVYIKTNNNPYGTAISPLPFPSNSPTMLDASGNSIIVDKSRYVISDQSCAAPAKEFDLQVVSYYASMKNIFDNQWGQIYSYVTIDTGFQQAIDLSLSLTKPKFKTVFGGDTFISRFAFKTKLPFFIDNRVGAPDDSDIFYDEIGNIAYPKYWHSSRSILEDYTLGNGATKLYNIISYKAHKFDCPNDPVKAGRGGGTNRSYYDGYFYLFAYGIPNFYCESSYNVNLRQAFNNLEGDFWPHVSTGIPDNWLQESVVTIAQDNTYYYNVTYSKQNKENYFSHLPEDWDGRLCFTYYPFRAIYSEAADANPDIRVNSWLNYGAISYFDFPQNFGNLVSLDGIQNKAVLARFENKSLLYNTLLTVQTSNPQAAYLGNDTLFKSSPPIDFAETDLGYVGSQNKMLLKIPQGQISIDAKRGQVFLVTGNQATDLSASGSGMNRFFTDHLAFEILRYFPDVNTDNHYNGLGLHGVYDSKFDRVIISKLDYIPLNKDIVYDATTRDFYLLKSYHDAQTNTDTEYKEIIYLTDPEYFCNKSWTLSFNMNTKSWISFHSYIPNFYIAENNFFYSGLNGCCDDLEVIAINEVPYTTTTSTTGNASKSTTSTTTLCLTCKPSLPPCALDGYANELNCELTGVAIIIVPSPTTTTICVRPSDLVQSQFIYGYIYDSTEIVSSGSKLDACSAITFISKTNINSTDINYYAAYSKDLELGTTVYFGIGDDCTLFPDGYYFTDQGIAQKYVYYIVGGKIYEKLYCPCEMITTTTTTTIGDINIPECCGMVFTTGSDLFYILPSGASAKLPFVSSITSSLIAMTLDKLWIVNGASVDEFCITTTPFSSSFNRNIILPGGLSLSGMLALNDSTLVACDNSVSPSEIIQLNISGGTATSSTQFTLQVGRTGVGNPLYTTTGKLIIINTDGGDSYISQYDYATGTLEFDINLSPLVPETLFSCNCSTYFTIGSDVYAINETSPFYTTFVYSLDFSPTGETQQINCITSSFKEEATTTTTTTL